MTHCVIYRSPFLITFLQFSQLQLLYKYQTNPNHELPDKVPAIRFSRLIPSIRFQGYFLMTFYCVRAAMTVTL